MSITSPDIAVQTKDNDTNPNPNPNPNDLVSYIPPPDTVEHHVGSFTVTAAPSTKSLPTNQEKQAIPKDNSVKEEYFCNVLYHLYMKGSKIGVYEEIGAHCKIEVHPSNRTLDVIVNQMQQKLLSMMKKEERDRIKSMVLIDWKLVPNKF
jgi:hypothetical protein